MHVFIVTCLSNSLTGYSGLVSSSSDKFNSLSLVESLHIDILDISSTILITLLSCKTNKTRLLNNFNTGVEAIVVSAVTGVLVQGIGISETDEAFELTECIISSGIKSDSLVRHVIRIQVCICCDLLHSSSYKLFFFNWLQNYYIIKH